MEERLFQNITFLKNLSLTELLMFLIYLFLIFVGKWVVTLIVRKFFKSESLRARVMPAVYSVLNWISFYSAIILFLFYFSTEKWLFYPFYETEDVKVTLFLIIVAIMIIPFASQLVQLFTSYVMPLVYDQFKVDTGLSYTFNRVIYYSVMFLAIALSFTTVGLDLSALAVIFSVLGIGIGFGMRNVAANFVSGIIILFERPIEVGEVIQIGDKIGKIDKIRLRSTVVETPYDGVLVVPNQHFIEQIIKNRTNTTLTAIVKVSVAYGTDTKWVESLLEEAVIKETKLIEGVIPGGRSSVRFVDFRSKALDFQVEVPVQDIQTKDQLENCLRHTIAEIFLKNNIELASAVHVTEDISKNNSPY